MNAAVLLLLLMEAAASLLVLYFSGLLKKPAHVLICCALTALAFLLRGLGFSHETLDYLDFLSPWVEYFRQNGGFAALGKPIGNYNVPYLYFLALFSYSSISELYLIKLLSTGFDVLLAYAAMRLAGRYTRSNSHLIVCFYLVLLCPTVMLNGAYWGQCDSIYAAFALLALWLALDGKPAWGMVCMAVSFAFKLQAVFIMPIFAVLLVSKRVKLWHFLLFPAAYILLVLPAVIAGRPFLGTLTLYFDQMDTVGSALNYNSPSVYAFIRDAQNPELASKLGVFAAFAFMLCIIALSARQGGRLSDWAILGAAIALCIGIPYLLPHMHERYFFLADILSIVLAVCVPVYFAMPILCLFASLLGYHAYLMRRYLLLMHNGAIALAAALLLALAFFVAQLEIGKKRA